MGKRIRAFVDVGYASYGISRVAFNLAKYLPPEVDIATEGAVDMTVLHVNGRHDHALRRASNILAQGNQYAVIQYVLQSCRNPDPKDWIELWSNAKVVWSYYDLRKYVPDLYHAPLAADPEKFYKQDMEKKYLVGTNGNTYGAECIGEVQHAAYYAGGNAVHVGEKFNSDPIVEYFTNIDDNRFREIYNQCRWFSCLRRGDGFEITAVEALLCGVRPIMFDTPNYRQWFDGLAEFIPEVGSGEVAGRLKRIFKNGPKPVTDAEIQETKNRFNWEKIINGFWERCMT